MADLLAMMTMAWSGLTRLSAHDGTRTAAARLATGRRVNQASDDAAGLAISERLLATSRAQGVIGRGINEAIGRVQQADAGLTQIAGLIQDARDLAIESGNGALKASDRARLQTNYEMLLAQIDATAAGTRLFGQSLLIAPQESDTPDLNRVFGESGRSLWLNSGIRPIARIPAGMRNVEIEVDALGADDDLQIFTTDGRHLLGTRLDDVVWRANRITTGEQVRERVMLRSLGFAPGAHYDDSGLLDGSAAFVDPALALAGEAALLETSLGGMTLDYSGDGDHQDDAPNDGRVSGSARHELLMIGEVTQSLLVMVVGSGSFGARARWTDADPTTAGSLDDAGPRVVLSADFGQASQGMTLALLPADRAALGLSGSGIATQAAARSSLSALDQALETVGSHRGRLGAQSRRLEQALGHCEAAAPLNQFARSRIIDADMATELAALARQRLREQIGPALLGQATLMPRQVLALLLGHG